MRFVSTRLCLYSRCGTCWICWHYCPQQSRGGCLDWAASFLPLGTMDSDNRRRCCCCCCPILGGRSRRVGEDPQEEDSVGWMEMVVMLLQGGQRLFPSLILLCVRAEDGLHGPCEGLHPLILVLVPICRCCRIFRRLCTRPTEIEDSDADPQGGRASSVRLILPLLYRIVCMASTSITRKGPHSHTQER